MFRSPLVWIAFHTQLEIALPAHFQQLAIARRGSCAHPFRNVCFTVYVFLKVRPAPKPCPWRYLQVDSSLPDLPANFAPATNVSIFPSNEFVLDTCPAPSVLQTHSLYEWGPRVVLYRCISQAARLFFSPIRVCDSGEDFSNLQEKSSKTGVSALIFLAPARFCRNSVPARKLTRWWEVP